LHTLNAEDTCASENCFFNNFTSSSGKGTRSKKK